ncbi:MAG: nuclear transport factor 2 family protein [Pedobacter sp.]|nr:MAG: nuclear transport factor 2 family protein [Pedobacter sp.]
MKLVSIILLMVFSLGACKKRQAPLTEAEVIAVIKRFDDAWRDKNLSVVDSVLAPSYVYFTQSGGTFSRANLVETAGSPDYTLEQVRRFEYYVQLLENTAVVSTRWQGKGIYKTVPFDEDQRCSVIIYKHNNKVEILSEHCTPIKPNRIFH